MTDSTHDHAKATGSATRTGKSKAGGIDATVADLQKADLAQVAWNEHVMTTIASFDQRVGALEAKAHAHTTPPPDDPPPVEPPPVTPPPATTVVNSIAGLYAALATNEADITLAPGTYFGGVFFDSRYAARTRPAVIRCSGATFTGGGFTFRGGAHDLEVLDPTFANWSPNQTGVLMFGGWDEPAAHHITVRRPKILGSVKRSLEANTSEHGVYFSIAQGGIHDVRIEDLDVDATGPMGLASAIHADHGTSTQTAWNITARRTVFRGNGTQGSSVQYPLILWTPSYHDWLFDGATITNANGSAIRVQSTTSRAIVFKDIVSTGSRYPSATSTPGVTFTGCSLK